MGTPKSYHLGLAPRRLTGPTRVFYLLNRPGYCASHSTTLAFEAIVAQLQLNHRQAKKNTILVWDNIDFAEETGSGFGTTHHTNGIMMQHDQMTERQSNSHPPLEKKQKTLKTELLIRSSLLSMSTGTINGKP